MWASLRSSCVTASEKRMHRVVREEGLDVAYSRRRRRGHGSYVGRDFHASEPDEPRPANITEFRLPSGAKVYLSPVVDCFDGMPVAWSIGTSPSAELANLSLLKALTRRHEGALTVINSDRGGHYRWPGWVRICEEGGLVRSMSAKGPQPQQRDLRGVLRAPQERVLLLPRLEGRNGRGVHAQARRPPPLPLRGQDKEVLGLA